MEWEQILHNVDQRHQRMNTNRRGMAQNSTRGRRGLGTNMHIGENIPCEMKDERRGRKTRRWRNEKRKKWVPKTRKVAKYWKNVQSKNDKHSQHSTDPHNKRDIWTKHNKKAIYVNDWKKAHGQPNNRYILYDKTIKMFQIFCFVRLFSHSHRVLCVCVFVLRFYLISFVVFLWAK